MAINAKQLIDLQNMMKTHHDSGPDTAYLLLLSNGYTAKHSFEFVITYMIQMFYKGFNNMSFKIIDCEFIFDCHDLVTYQSSDISILVKHDSKEIYQCFIYVDKQACKQAWQLPEKMQKAILHNFYRFEKHLTFDL